MELPKLNKRKRQSKIHQSSLKNELLKTIERFEYGNEYKFEPYEVDNILLDIIKQNHISYLNAKFGDDTI